MSKENKRKEIKGSVRSPLNSFKIWTWLKLENPKTSGKQMSPISFLISESAPKQPSETIQINVNVTCLANLQNLIHQLLIIFND